MNYQFTTPHPKVACFDLDFTLIKPKNGRQFSKNISDWEYLNEYVMQTLKKLRSSSWKVVIFTNQKKTKTSLSFDDLVKKLEHVLPFTPDVYMSYDSDYFRKPMKGMWDEFISLNGVPETAFYVGDAAGRESDHSDTDRRFAYNIGIPYYLPEEIFNNEFKNFTPVHHIHPSLKDIPITPKFPAGVMPILNITKPTIIIMVGPPASGKSFLSRKIAAEHPGTIIISNDETGSSAKSKKMLKQYVSESTKIIIIDNTSPSITARYEYLSLAPSYHKISINAILPIEYCILLDEQRAYERKSNTVPTLVYRIYKSKYVNPSKKEGFDELRLYIPSI